MSRSLFEKMVKCGQNTFFSYIIFTKKEISFFFNSTNFTVLEQAHYHSSLGVITSRCWEKIEYIVHFIVYFYIKCVALYRCFIYYNFHTVYKDMFGPVLFPPSLSVDKFQYYFSWNATVSEKLFASAEGEHYN